MALVLAEGFDYRLDENLGNEALLNSRGWSEPTFNVSGFGAAGVGSPDSRTGREAAIWYASDPDGSIMHDVTISGDTIIVGMALFCDTFDTGPDENGDCLFQLFPATGDNAHIISITLSNLAGGFYDLNVRRGTYNATIVATHVDAVADNTWQYIELKIVLKDDATGSSQCRRDDAVIDTVSSIQTITTGQVVGRLMLSAGGGANHRDDVVVLDTSGSVNNDYLGTVDIRLMEPVGRGSSEDFTLSDPLISRIKHTRGQRSDTALLSNPQYELTATTVGDKELTKGAPHPSLDPIAGVVVNTVAKKSDAGSKEYSFLLKQGASVSNSANVLPPTTYFGESAIFEVDPSSGIAFVTADLDDLEYGVEIEV